MNSYLGEREVPIAETPYATFDRVDWVLFFINKQGGLEGRRDKQRLIDKLARIGHGAPVVVRLAEWAKDGVIVEHEYRFEVGTSAAYEAWIAERKADDRDWDTGA